MMVKMKKVGWIFVLLFIISGCGQKKSTISNSSTEIQISESIISETSSTKISSTKPTIPTQETTNSTQVIQNQTLAVEGNWTASGKEDKIESNWLFKDTTLTINGKEIYYYEVSPKIDKNGYTYLKIVNVESIAHGLVLKKSPTGMSGYTVEGDAYQAYLKTEVLPKNQQEIEFVSSIGDPTIWKNKDEAIDFYENTYKNTSNEISKNIFWDNYQRDLWNILEDGTYDNVIAMHFSNIGGAGGSYIRLTRSLETTEMITFNGNATYPDRPSNRYVIRNSDYLVIETENY